MRSFASDQLSNRHDTKLKRSLKGADDTGMQVLHQQLASMFGRGGGQRLSASAASAKIISDREEADALVARMFGPKPAQSHRPPIPSSTIGRAIPKSVDEVAAEAGVTMYGGAKGRSLSRFDVSVINKHSNSPRAERSNTTRSVALTGATAPHRTARTDAPPRHRAGSRSGLAAVPEGGVLVMHVLPGRCGCRGARRGGGGGSLRRTNEHERDMAVRRAAAAWAAAWRRRPDGE